MADKEFSRSLLYLPRQVALTRLPMGLPSGHGALCNHAADLQVDVVLPLSGLVPRNPIPKEYRDHVLKFVPVLKSYNLKRAASHLEQWIAGTWEPAPLLDVSLTLACHLSSLCPMTRVLGLKVKASSQASRCCLTSGPHGINADLNACRMFEPGANAVSLLGLKGRVFPCVSLCWNFPGKPLWLVPSG